MLDWQKRSVPAKILAAIVLGATIATSWRGIYAMVHTDKLSDWVTVALWLGIPAGWIWLGANRRG